MFVIIGIVIVFGAVVAGYLMEKGNLRVLIQPAELVIIAGAAIGTVLIANPLHILKSIVSGIVGAFGGSKFSKDKYLETLKMMFELFTRARKEGLMALETDSDAPDKSPIFSKYPKFLKDHHALHFVCDTMRMAAGGGVEPFDVDQMMELDMDVHHHEATHARRGAFHHGGLAARSGNRGGGAWASSSPWAHSADRRKKSAHKVAAALVGTFLGILLCYGLIGPHCFQHGQGRRRRACLLPRSARRDHFLHERHAAHDGRGIRASRYSGACAALVSGNGKVHQEWRRSSGTRGGSSRVRTTEKRMAGTPPIIIKKKVSHPGHHGGAWKVAYADFVTAMMALFIVLWLLNSSKQIQEAVGGYFKDPTGTAKQVGSDQRGAAENFVLSQDNMQQLKEQLQKAIKEVPKFDLLKNHIDMTVTNEGLRIELSESATGTFFDSGKARISEGGEELLIVIAEELGKLPNKLAIEGHTDSKPYAAGSNYGNWELSSDRANAARRLLQLHGIRVDQITQVRGFANQRLRRLNDPLDPANRRISLIVQYMDKNSPEQSKPAEEGKPGEDGAKAGEVVQKLAEKAGEKPTEKPVERPPEKK